MPRRPAPSLVSAPASRAAARDERRSALAAPAPAVPAIPAAPAALAPAAAAVPIDGAEQPAAGADQEIERRIAQRLARLRADRGWPLEALAERTGISRATLSRIERAELSPTAAMLGRLCTVYGWTLSRLMADVETPPPTLVRAAEQAEWTDPESGYRRRALSPPAARLRGELVEVRVPAGATVAFDSSPIAGLEHHLWMLDGALTLALDDVTYQLRAGDCLRYLLAGPSRFHNSGKREARYVIAIVRP